MIPVLQTERLQLRGYQLSDFPDHAAIWAHPRTTRDFEGYDYDEEMCWLRFQRNIGQWHLFGYGMWAVADRQSDRFIGAVGFMQARRAIDVPFSDMPEAGWVIAPHCHGQGLAREALTAAFAWADDHIEAPQTWCMINPPNAISQKVAARFGYRRAKDSSYKGKPVQTWLRPRGAR
jgi:RimJ/RimL family protein N-acetyltransferase